MFTYFSYISASSTVIYDIGYLIPNENIRHIVRTM